MDFSSLGSSLREANYAFLIPAVALYFVSVWFRTLRWQYLLRNTKAIPQRRLYPVVVIGYMANNLLPVRLGELVRAYFLGTKENVSKTTALATIVVERTFDGVTLLLFAMALAMFLPMQKAFAGLGPLLVVLVIAAFIVVFGALVLVASSRRFTDGMVSLGLRVVPKGQREKARSLVTRFVEGLESMRSPGKILALLLLSVPVWLTEAVMYYTISLGFGLNQLFTVILLVTAAANLAITAPSTGGGIGPFELATKVVLVAFGQEASLATAYAIVLHATLLIPVTLLGLLFLWTENLTLGEIARRPQGEWSSASSASPASPEQEAKR